MNIVVPMAGRGSRFLKEASRNPEYSKPKPLINIAGRTMIEWALSSFPISKGDQLIFLVLKEHIEKANIDKILKNIFGDKIKIIIVDKVTKGAACTALLAKEFINNEQPLIITDSDNYLDGKTLFQDIKTTYKRIDGMIPIFYSNDSKWSFVKINEKEEVIETAEKTRISRNAIIGAYYFKKGEDFVLAAEEMIEKNDKMKGEFYIAPVYNYLIRRGKLIIISRPRFFYGLGTPKDLENFLKLLKRREVTHNFNNLSL